MDLTIVIICSTDILLTKCLQSIPDGVPILVVLNNPNKVVLDIVSNDIRVKTIRYDKLNLGYLRQLAADTVTTRSIMYIDSDCVIEQGTVECVMSELENFAAVSIPMKYCRESFSTAIVSRCREFTTPDDALFMPAAFRLDVQVKIGGYLYDKRLSWGEDSDQKQRFLKNNIPFTISKGCVWHRALNFYTDARSATRLGMGRLVQEKCGYFSKRSFLKDYFSFKDIHLTIRCAKKAGIIPAIYHLFVWRPAYKYGYWKEVFKRGR